ncbi:MAG: hypothetical protein BBJ57_10215 [Desulfobacterales bacterium PC51MH44]|nr:MAG: hypothetical protein BBJ57_10215 [Desulfobacterales bacterium PC51MH44]
MLLAHIYHEEFIWLFESKYNASKWDVGPPKGPVRYSKFDGFVKSPTSALCFISLSLRSTKSTPHDTKFARLEFGAFYFAI